MFFTYLFSDPKTLEPIYVGKGKGNRPFKHVTAPTRLGNFIRARFREGIVMIPTRIPAPSELSALAMERFWIAVCGRENLGTGTLFNLTDGGEGFAGLVKTEEHKAKIGAANAGRKFGPRTEAHKRAISAAHTGRQKPTVSAALKGRKRVITPEHAQNIANANRARARKEIHHDE